MVRRRIHRIRIATMISGNQQKVRVVERLEKRPQQLVELLKRTCEALHIFAMPIEHVEIDQVCKDESCGPAPKSLCEFRHSVRIVFCGHILGHASPVVNVMNFADAENWNVASRQHIEQHRSRRLNCIVVPPLGSPKTSGPTGKWPRDHAPYAMRSIEQRSRNFAHAIKL